MRKIMIGLMALVSVPAIAAPADRGDIAQVCEAMGGMAEQILDTRYSGASLSRAIGVVNGIQDANFRKLVHQIVMEAYREPAYSTYEFQAQAKRDFRNKWEFVCYEELMPRG